MKFIALAGAGAGAIVEIISWHCKRQGGSEGRWSGLSPDAVEAERGGYDGR